MGVVWGGGGGASEKAATLEGIKHRSPGVTVKCHGSFRDIFVLKIATTSASTVRINQHISPDWHLRFVLFVQSAQKRALSKMRNEH